MPRKHCAVIGCHWSSTKLAERLKQPCFEHKGKTMRECSCPPQFVFDPLPKDPDAHQITSTSVLFHFSEREPTESHPNPQKVTQTHRKSPKVTQTHRKSPKPTESHPNPPLMSGYATTSGKKRYVDLSLLNCLLVEAGSLWSKQGTDSVNSLMLCENAGVTYSI